MTAWPRLAGRLRPGSGDGYWKLLAASTISNFGDGVSAVAYPWLASAITRDPVQLASVAVARWLPWLLFTLPAGVIIDRVDRRRLVAAMNAFQFVLTLVVGLAVLLGSERLADPHAVAAAAPPSDANGFLVLLAVSALAFGAAEVLRDNAAGALLPSLVAKDELERANARLWSAERLMNFLLGRPAGGFLLAAGLALPFFVDAGTFAVSAILISLIAGAYRPRREEAGPRSSSWRRELGEGLGWVWRQPLLRSMAVIIGVSNMMFSLSDATFVLFAQEVLGLAPAGYGLLLTAAAVGGVAGGLAAPRVREWLGSGPAMFLPLAGFGASLTVAGLTSSPLVVWTAYVVASFLGMVWNVLTVSLTQAIIPDELMGRVRSVLRFVAWGTIPLGLLLGGVLVDLVEIVAPRGLALRTPFVLAGAVHGLLVLFALPRWTTGEIEAARRQSEAS